LKKRTKKLLLVAVRAAPVVSDRGKENEQKFFVSFFQKRRPFFCLP
jgi:hypothetical protein